MPIMMKNCVVFLFSLLILLKNEAASGNAVRDSPPQQQPFDSTQCYYCNQASSWIYGLSTGFPAFESNNQSFIDYLNTMQSVVCDIDNDDPVCLDTVSQVSTVAYQNWMYSCVEKEYLGKFVKIVTELACQKIKDICKGVSEFLELIDYCIHFGVINLCPAPSAPCVLCTKYYSCPTDSSCLFTDSLLCPPKGKN